MERFQFWSSGEYRVLPLLPGRFWFVVVLPVGVSFISPIDLFKKYSYSIGPWEKSSYETTVQKMYVGTKREPYSLTPRIDMPLKSINQSPTTLGSARLWERWCGFREFCLRDIVISLVWFGFMGSQTLLDIWCQSFFIHKWLLNAKIVVTFLNELELVY